MNRSRIAKFVGGLVGAAALVMLPAGASTEGFIVPAFRGAPASQTGTWETFTVPIGSPGNLADQPAANTSAVLVQTDPGAFLTGSGNLYNMGGTSRFELTDDPPGPVGTVVLQVRTIGTELDDSAVRLVFSNSSGGQEVRPLFRQELSRTSGQGFNVSSLWQWDLTGLGVESYTILFAAAGHSLSLDSVRLDTAPQFSPAMEAQPFMVGSAPATLARWMYPFNSDPAGRPTASVFGALGSAGDFDSRDAQYLLGWSTTNSIPAGRGATRYLLRRARVTLTVATESQYPHLGTIRDFRTYFPTNDPRYLSPTNSGFPLELFGVGFRGGFTGPDGIFIPYTATNYPQNGPWAALPAGGFFSNRVAYAAGFDTRGSLVDVSNNVGDDGTNEIATAFEVAPFGIGQTTNVAPGQALMIGSSVTFDLNLDDPLIHSYVRQALHQGQLSLMLTSLVPASMSGAPAFPTFFTPFSLVARPDQYPLLDLEGRVMRPEVDTDSDGLPDDWENFHFGSLLPLASEDADGDLVSNLAEYQSGTLPGSADSVLRLVSLTTGEGEAELQFTAAPDVTPSVQWSEKLGEWQPPENSELLYTSEWLSKSVPAPSYPAPVLRQWWDSGATNTQRFYRVVTP